MPEVAVGPDALVRVQGAVPPRWGRSVLDLVAPLVTPTEQRLALAPGSLVLRQLRGDEVARSATPDAGRVLTFVTAAAGAPPAQGLDVRVRPRPEVDRRLHHLLAPVPTPLPPTVDGEVLAAGEAGAGWVRRRHGRAVEDVVAGAFPAPGPEGRLLTPDLDASTLALLVLVHVLRELSGVATVRPGLRAALVVDDPNLRCRRYGFLDLAEARELLERRRAHLSVATIPIDAPFARRPVAELFRRSERLSLSVHGNRHLHRELADVDSPEAAAALGAQALGRLRRLSRLGVPVEPVMVPPHGAASVATLRGLRAAGFAGVCYTGPVDQQCGRAPVNLYPADVHLPDGVAGLHRWRFDISRDYLRARAFLDQPLVLYGHHDDFAGGLGVLDDAIGDVERFGPVRWMSLHELLRGNLAWSRRGDEQVVAAWSDEVVLGPEAWAQSVRVLWPGGTSARLLRPLSGWTDRLVLRSPRALPAPPAARPPWLDRRLPGALVRRAATESRDRLLPRRAQLARWRGAHPPTH
ncbi:MAG TPA: hypothetical protein VFS29_06835 [Motilibacteraceae bacterium]|nr:hypothetical protein [Motilibacteraceae bacterium]